MSNVLESRNEFLTGISLSEISFIFFMLLVLISLHSIYKYKKDLESTTNKLTETSEELKNLKIKLADTSLALEDAKKALERNKNKLEETIKKLKKTEDDLKFFKEASTKQAAIIVRLPPSSVLRAAPKNLFGGYKATGSIPPDKVLPLVGNERL